MLLSRALNIAVENIRKTTHRFSMGSIERGLVVMGCGQHQFYSNDTKIVLWVEAPLMMIGAVEAYFRRNLLPFSCRLMDFGCYKTVPSPRSINGRERRGRGRVWMLIGE